MQKPDKITHKKELLELCDKISADVENDAREFDGKPFSGKIVAEYFGYHGAAIDALSRILKILIEDTYKENDKTQ